MSVFQTEWMVGRQEVNKFAFVKVLENKMQKSDDAPQPSSTLLSFICMQALGGYGLENCKLFLYTILLLLLYLY